MMLVCYSYFHDQVSKNALVGKVKFQQVFSGQRSLTDKDG
jgi:hypothetical protein